MKKLLLIGILCLSLFSRANCVNQTASKTGTITVKTEVFNPEVATQKYLDMLTPDEKKKSDSYFEGGYWLMLWNMLMEFGVAWVFLSMGLSQWIRKIASKAKNINLQNLIYIGFYFLFAYLISFPLNLYQNFFREHKYNLSNLTFGVWMGEEIKGLLLTIIFGALILMLIYIAIRKVKQNWWIWASGIAILFVIFSLFIGPIFISPLFNKYKPLEEGQLKNEILSIARANGVPADNVYEFDASKQSNKISANVSGFGSTARISLNDNLINRSTPAEVKAVMAHEIGHYVLNHIYKGIIMLIFVIVIGFALVNWALKKAVLKWGKKWKITDISDIVSLPLFVLLFTLFMFFARPVFNNISRTTEIEADYFGFNAAQEPDAFSEAIMKLSEYRKINPGPWEEIIFYDHPSGRTRIHNAMVWKAEHLDKK